MHISASEGWLAVMRDTCDGNIRVVATFNCSNPLAHAACAKTFDYLRWSEGSDYGVAAFEDTPRDLTYGECAGPVPVLGHAFNGTDWLAVGPLLDVIDFSRHPLEKAAA